MDLFHDDFRVPCTAEEWELLWGPLNGNGGIQRLLRKLHTRQIAERTLILDAVILGKCCEYAYNYGDGTYQKRLRAVIGAAIRTGQWAPDAHNWRQRRKKGTGKRFGAPPDGSAA